MKFVTLVNRNYVIASAIIFVIASGAAFYILQILLIERVKEEILDYEQMVIYELESGSTMNTLYPIIELNIVDESYSVENSFTKVFIEDKYDDGEAEPFMEFVDVVDICGLNYKLTIRRSLVEYDELLLSISILLISVLSLVTLLAVWINFRLNASVWMQFTQNLDIIRRFSFRDSKGIELKKTSIHEFNDLNNAVVELTNKLLVDYEAIKKFTENASHEFQTPIAVILINLDEMLQEKISPGMAELIVSTQQSVKRLSDLNRNLLLLTQIENQQFGSIESIHMNDLTERKVKELEALTKSRNIQFVIEHSGHFYINISSVLADILINNLLSNAVMHNYPGGEVRIEFYEGILKISNTGEDNQLTNATIFNRFTKSNSQSYGLGLAIVKQICDTHGIEISYVKNNLHTFILSRSDKL